MEISKAIILAGRGPDECPWPTSTDEPRHLFPVANRPILFHNLEALRSAGVLETAICAEPAAAGPIRRAVGDGREWGLSVRHANWDPRVGVAGALAAGRDFLRGDPVLVQHGDALLSERLHGHISTFAREDLDVLALRVPRPSDGPAGARMPWYLLSPRAIAILGDGGDAAADPVEGVRAHGGRVRILLVDGCVPCQGDMEALLDGNRRMLERLATQVDPCSLDASSVQGAAHVHPTARIRRTLLRGPVVIGPGAQVTDAYIGPYTSIGAGVVVEGTEIEHSIVLPDAELRFVGTRLESSVIGRGARIVRRFRLPGAIRMSIGDRAEVVLT